MIAALDATPLTVPTGGVTRYTAELAMALAAAFPDDRYWWLSDQIFSAPLAANLHKGDGPRTAAERRWWLWGLEREMMRRRVEVFHGTDFSVPYISRRPSVMTLHDLSPWRDQEPDSEEASPRVRRRVPVLLRAGIPTMIITPSEAVRRAAISRFKLDHDRVIAVPEAASRHFRPVENPAGRPYFLFVGTLEPRKNIHRLIEAWREVRQSEDIDLVLAGRAREGFPAPAPEPGLQVLGAVPEDALPALYSGAVACVYPSLYEGFGLPVLEAMQCGTTVITSRDPAIMEVSGGAALHVDATDVRALAEAMRARPIRREQSLKRAAMFSWPLTARKTREVYDAARRFFKA